MDFTASVNKTTLNTDQRFQYTISSNSDADIYPPSLLDFKVISGPIISTQQNYSYINGQYNLSTKYSYTYVLQPKEKGTFTIDPARMTVSGKHYETDSFEITVTESNTETVSATSNLMIRMSVNHNEVYQGEAVVATYYLYARYPQIQNIRYDYPINFPIHNGFWMESFEQTDINWEDEIKYIDGVAYRYAVFHREVLIPLHHGELQLDPFEMSVIVNINFFGQGTPYELKSNSPTITVKPLPEPVPEDFTGAVGEYTMRVSVDTSAKVVGEPITITVDVSGKGNLKLMDDIILDIPTHFELYEPQIKENIKTTIGGMTGTKTYQFLVIPRQAGNYTLGPLSFSYFDPDSKSYKNMYSGELQFDIAKGDGTDQGSYTVLNKQDVEILNEDIRFINTNSDDLREKGTRFYGSPLHLAGVLAPGLAFLLFVLVYRKKQKDAQDVVGMKSKKATAVATKRLANAKKLLNDPVSHQFHDEIMKALYGYLGDKLNMGMSGINKESIVARLSEAGVPTSLSNEHIRLLEECELARYAPVTMESEQRLYNEALNVIRETETHLKK